MRILSLQFRFLRLLKFILNYTAGSDVIVLLRWDKRSSNKVFVACSDVLPEEKSDFAIVVARFKISYGIYN